MKLSYLVTCKNEDRTLDESLSTIIKNKDEEDEIIVLSDFSDNPKTKEVFNKYSQNIQLLEHALDRNYGGHKNYGNSNCHGDWIFQIDGDEIPNENLIINIKEVISLNTESELIFVPRINDFKGVTDKHAMVWGWRLTPFDYCDGRPVVNWPDYQCRVYKNDPNRIKWDRKLHEKIEGHKHFTKLPEDPQWALYHDKTIEKQMETNKRYNEWFSKEENQGHNVF